MVISIIIRLRTLPDAFLYIKGTSWHLSIKDGRCIRLGDALRDGLLFFGGCTRGAGAVPWITRLHLFEGRDGFCEAAVACVPYIKGACLTESGLSVVVAFVEVALRRAAVRAWQL